MPDPVARPPLALSAGAAAMALVVSLAGGHAIRWYGHAFPGVLITADGIVSSIGMPSWSGLRQGLRFPDRVEAIDGLRLENSSGELPSRAWDRAMDQAVSSGRQTVTAHVLTSEGPRDVELEISRLDAWSWWLYAATTIFMAGLYSLSALLALWAKPSGVLARAFAKFALLAAAFFATFFDAHTTRAMVPLFHGAFAWAPFALAALSLRLPDDVAFVARRPWVFPALDGAGILLAVTVLVRVKLGLPVAGLQSACTLLFGAAMIAFVVILAVRYTRASGTRRATMRVLLQAMAMPYVLVGGGVLFTMLSSQGSVAAFFALPALAMAPVATGVVFIRHDVFGSRTILSRVSTRALGGAVACVVASGLGAAFAAFLGVEFRGALIAAAAGAVASAGLVVAVTRLIESRFFPAAAQYKPTIEQLSEELTEITDPREVGLAVERTVRRWLPCERVDFRAGGAPPPTPSGGERAIAAEFGGEKLGWLIVGPKRGGALFTTDDLDLLSTIANQAALALAHALSYAELEQRRLQQAAAWQTERVALVETVAAEIAHEVRYPINFFRTVFRHDKKGAKLDEEEIDIGCEEVDRLERLVAGLRKMVGHRIERRPVAVADLAARVEMLLRDALSGRPLDVHVPANTTLRCDPDQATQVLVNLVANAIDATGGRGHIGVAWGHSGEDSQLIVWDDGPGFDVDAAQLFAPWFTTKPRGTGLGLAITHRIVRAHGWSIDAVRTDGQTRFVVAIPKSDVSAPAGDGQA
ncbi:MAG TPA: HAMP domain-containing sensor histidine kinase [Polyangiaceae bacterium]